MRIAETIFARCGGSAFQRALALLTLALGLGVTPLPGVAATIVVKSSGDTGSAATCTLRQAVVSMNAGSVAGTGCVNSGASAFHTVDTINFDVTTFPIGGANTITLADVSTGTISIDANKNLTIDANANGNVTIQRPSGATNNFAIISQGQPGGGELTLSHLTLSNAAYSGVANTFANGSLTLTNCTVTGTVGSGITVSGNLTLINSTVSGNYGGSVGGGIYGNTGGSGSVTVINSTISGNVASQGAGIYTSMPLTLTNSTVTGNHAHPGGGGGIYAIGVGAIVTLTNTTISANQGDGFLGANVQPLLINSIIAGNTTQDLNLYSSPAPGSSGNFIGGDPQLGALANNGGPTWTMLPARGSPVVDAIACTNAPATDQRGIARPQGAQCDIGAVEATLAEKLLPPTIKKIFGAATIPDLSTTSLTFTIANPNAMDSLTGVAFTDSLPAGMVVATPNGLTKTCGGTATAAAGASSASLSGATLAAGTSCTMVLVVQGTTPGVKNNSVQVNSTNGGLGNTSNATLAVRDDTIYSNGFEVAVILTLGSGFNQPNGVAVDANGNVFVADTNNSAVKEILVPGYTTVITLGSGFSYPAGVAVYPSGNVFITDNNSVKEILAPGYTTAITLGSGFSYPIGIAVDASGNVFVADTDNNAVKEMLAPGYTTINTLGSGFNSPYGVAIDASGNVFVADTNNNAVREILAAGGYTTVITLGSGFNSPYGVAVDASGNVFVADTYNNAVKEMLAPGYTTVITLGSEFNQPYGVAVDALGNVFVADTGNNAVKEIVR
ncbi:NHL repeat-containing protein [Pseudolysobacter antarcticus]|nr:NHL repeat-containing protein [Pseudolysobacter antarcticus]